MTEPLKRQPSALARWSSLAFRALLGCAVIAITGFGVATLHQRAGADASISLDFLAGYTVPPPYVAANLDFSGEPGLQAYVDAGVIAPATVIKERGELIGVHRQAEAEVAGHPQDAPRLGDREDTLLAEDVAEPGEPGLRPQNQEGGRQRLGEQHPVLGQRVEHRRRVPVAAVAAEIPVSQIVGQDQNDVWPVGAAGALGKEAERDDGQQTHCNHRDTLESEVCGGADTIA